MQIQASDPRNIQNCLRQNLSISHGHDHLRIKRANLFDRFTRANACRLKNRDCASSDRRFDRWSTQLLIAARWFVGLRDHAGKLMPSRLQKRVQCRHADLARADKNKAHPRQDINR